MWHQAAKNDAPALRKKLVAASASKDLRQKLAVFLLFVQFPVSQGSFFTRYC